MGNKRNGRPKKTKEVEEMEKNIDNCISKFQDRMSRETFSNGGRLRTELYKMVDIIADTMDVFGNDSTASRTTPEPSETVDAICLNDQCRRMERYATGLSTEGGKVTSGEPFDSDSFDFIESSNSPETDPLIDTASKPADSRFIAMLRRVFRKVCGVFLLVLERIKNQLVEVWNRVCKAFSALFKYLGSKVQDLFTPQTRCHLA